MRSMILCIAIASTAFAQESIFPTKAQKQMARHLEPATVTEESRAFLKTKMKHHAKEMKDLSVAVATVKPDDVKRLAQFIADEARLDPAVGPATKLPKRFFELQEAQKKIAGELAATGDDLQAMQDKYGQLVEQCVACHAAFKTKK
jgi:cytochrome c556